MHNPPPFKAAVLVNSPGSSPIDTAFKRAFHARITTASPGVQVDFFDPIISQTYPEPGAYDLLVLTGSGGDADADAQDVDWVRKLRSWIRAVSEGGRGKIAAVCWGHQVVQVAFGGSLGALGNGVVEVGVHTVLLTEEGGEFFSRLHGEDLPVERSVSDAFSSLQSMERRSLQIHQFHEREVKTPGRGFVALAENNQCLVNEANTVLTFQGHPEMDQSLSRQLLEVSSRYVGADEKEKDALERRIVGEHDGNEIWDTIVGWARRV